MFKQIVTNINQATSLLIGVAMLGMLVTFGVLRLTNSVNRPVADVETPSLRVTPRMATVAPGQSIELSSQSLGFEPTSIVWLSSHDQITFSPVTGAVTTVSIPIHVSNQTVTITASAVLDLNSTIQDSIAISIE